jgi:hypothetical protein
VISARKAQLLSAKARNDQLYSTLAVRVMRCCCIWLEGFAG